MFCTIINDCRDANAAGRQCTKAISLLHCPTTFIGVKNDLEAAGNLLDMLDAGEGKKGVVLVNVAPRNGKAKQWKNGTPFGYFWYRNTLVIASIDGYTLSLAKQFGILGDFRALQTPPEYAKSQFRSFTYLPKIAKTLLDGERTKELDFDTRNIPETPKVVWWVDNFGNCKTTIPHEEVGFRVGQAVESRVGTFPYYESLKDVPDGEIAVVIGSSGLGGKRFLEIVKQGSNAAEDLGVSTGDVIY